MIDGRDIKKINKIKKTAISQTFSSELEKTHIYVRAQYILIDLKRENITQLHENCCIYCHEYCSDSEGSLSYTWSQRNINNLLIVFNLKSPFF